MQRDHLEDQKLPNKITKIINNKWKWSNKMTVIKAAKRDSSMPARKVQEINLWITINKREEGMSE